MMRKYLKVGLIVGFVVGVVFLAAPSSTDAAITQLFVSGDCSGATLTIHFSSAPGEPYQLICYGAWANPTGGGFIWFGGTCSNIYSGNVVNASLSWTAVPEGSNINVFAAHVVDGHGTHHNFSYLCGPGVYIPEPSGRVYINIDSPVYSVPDYAFPIDDLLVKGGQQFPLVGSETVGDMTWYRIWVGSNDYPYIPGSVATVLYE
jgi:hypothetical protein